MPARARHNIAACADAGVELHRAAVAGRPMTGRSTGMARSVPICAENRCTIAPRCKARRTL